MKINSKVEKICNVCTMYSLFLYLLCNKESEIEKTFFIFNPAGIPKSIRCNFKRSYTMPDYNSFSIICKILISLFGFAYFKYIRWSKLPKWDRNTQIVGNDFSRYDPIVIGKNNYTVIEDAPNGFYQSYLGFFEQFDKKAKKWGVLYKIMKWLYGETYYQRFGNNRLCTDVILTQNENISYLRSKNIHHVNIFKEWENSSRAKRDMIIRTFSISYNDINALRTKKLVVFTQPLYPDFITKEEHAKIYKKIIEKYPIEDVVVKTHPRDSYYYEKDIHGLYVFRSPVPSQLLDLLEIKFDKAITLFSTAVKTIPYDISIDWYGFAGNRTLESIIGNVTVPINANKIELE